ncbi:DUF3099 domain-containing protein [Streptomyces macrosporus]|uniref:DUF3099 domain-containing protein n=1 Tax=Streptomyces macrosporus TaxID=44032 RepID=UPI0031DDF359
MRRKQHGPEVFRITGARQGLAEDVRGRERRYVISMLVRTVSVLLTVLLWNVQRPLAVVTLVLGAVLPYVAVVIANGGRENAPSLPDSYIPTPPRPALGPAERGAAEGGPEAEEHKVWGPEDYTVWQSPRESEHPASGDGDEQEPSRSGPVGGTDPRH